MKMTRDSYDNNEFTLSCKIIKVVFSLKWNSVLIGNTDKTNEYNKLEWRSDRETNEADKEILAIIIKSQWVSVLLNTTPFHFIAPRIVRGSFAITLCPVE